MLVDLRPKKLTGKVAESALGRAHITCNKNGIPFDPEKPTVTSGIRLGTPAGTTRGFGIAEFRQVGGMIVEVLDVLSQKGTDEDSLTEGAVREKVKALLSRFPDIPMRNAQTNSASLPIPGRAPSSAVTLRIRRAGWPWTSPE